MTPPPSTEPVPVTVPDAELALFKSWLEGQSFFAETAAERMYKAFVGGMAADRARDQTRIRELETALADWNEHLGGCSAGISKLPCKCGLEEARAVVEHHA